jgi:hypothetical protein
VRRRIGIGHRVGTRLLVLYQAPTRLRLGLGNILMGGKGGFLVAYSATYIPKAEGEPGCMYVLQYTAQRPTAYCTRRCQFDFPGVSRFSDDDTP